MERNDKIIEKDGKKYKLNLIIDKTATDIHHILGQKYKAQYNVNIDQNKIRIPRKDHIDYNNFVKDKQSPREAMQKLYEMCKQVLTPGVKEIMETVLYKTDDDLFYIPELIKWKKKKNTNTQTKESADTDCK